MEQVILVDEDDRQVGSAEKLRAHREALLHRAFSIFVFDSEKRLLLQRRAQSKYHSGGLWSNTCCGHPRPGEKVRAAAARRLREEMNFMCELRAAFHFIYRAELGNGLVEHEYDHVLVGEFDGSPAPSRAEVEDWKRIGMDELRRELRERPHHYSSWLPHALAASEGRELYAFLRGS